MIKTAGVLPRHRQRRPPVLGSLHPRPRVHPVAEAPRSPDLPTDVAAFQPSALLAFDEKACRWFTSYPSTFVRHRGHPDAMYVTDPILTNFGA